MENGGGVVFHARIRVIRTTGASAWFSMRARSWSGTVPPGSPRQRILQLEVVIAQATNYKNIQKIRTYKPTLCAWLQEKSKIKLIGANDDLEDVRALTFVKLPPCTTFEKVIVVWSRNCNETVILWACESMWKGDRNEKIKCPQESYLWPMKTFVVKALHDTKPAKPIKPTRIKSPCDGCTTRCFCLRQTGWSAPGGRC